MASGKLYKAVAHGRTVGVMTDPRDVENATIKFPGYRVYATDDLNEAKAYIELYRNVPNDGRPIDMVALNKIRERIAKETVEEEPKSLEKVDVGSLDIDMLGKELEKYENPSEETVVSDELKMEFSPFDVVIYTDASYLPIQKSGGWAAVLMFSGGSDAVKVQVSGGKKDGESAFYMELVAMQKALKKLSHYKVGGRVYIFTDCKDIVNVVYGNYGAPQEYKSKQTAMMEELYKYSYEVRWVKAHNGNPYNEECDRISKIEARLAAL